LQILQIPLAHRGLAGSFNSIHRRMISAPMDNIDEIRLGILRARLELCEIEMLALSREILSPLTNFWRWADAAARWIDLSTERPEIAKQLDALMALASRT
jgi:hypothetical protein